MIAYGMLYAGAVGVPILLAAIAYSAALRRYGRPERGVWLVALGLALMLPVAFLVHPFGGIWPGASETLAESGVPALAAGALPETGVLGLPTVFVVSAEPSGPGLNEVLAFVWLLASTLLALRWAVAARRLSRAQASGRAGMMGGVRVWLTFDLGPAVSGILRTRILVPAWLEAWPDEQRSLVLLHEQEHIRARDPVLTALARIARTMAPWNPVVWLLSSRLLDAVELDCDRRVLDRRPDVETYGDTLLTVSARDSTPLGAVAAFSESRVALRKRIVTMTTPPRTVSVLGAVTVVTLGVALLIGSCEVPVPIALESEGQAAVPTSANIVRISIERDGFVTVNDEPHPMDNLAAVLTPLYASEPSRITSIRGDGEVSYQFMQRLQIELSVAGAVRVVWEAPEPLVLRSPSALAPLGQGLAMVLPDYSARKVDVLMKNVLYLVVQPSGLVEVKHGADPEVQQMQPRDIEGVWLRAVATNPNFIAAVMTHPDAPYRLMVEVLDALHSADAERISLQMQEREVVGSVVSPDGNWTASRRPDGNRTTVNNRRSRPAQPNIP